MYKMNYQTLLRCFAMTGGLLLSTLSFGEGYYRWIGENGVVHYGSRPPEGVEAELISTYGKSAAKNTSQQPSKEKVAGNTSYTAQQEALIEQRKAQCEQEKGRLSLLKRSGSRIQMEEADGSKRYLTPEEVVQEVTKSEQFISQACK